MNNKNLSKIVSNSLHFPGYLIAHLVYGYILLFFVSFAFIFLLKFLYNHTMLAFRLAQLLIPLFIIIFLKKFAIQWILPKCIVKKEKNESKIIYNISSYFIASYFNFFRLFSWPYFLYVPSLGRKCALRAHIGTN